jgi:predicted DNA-binding antitoxin AbrB/MazE fold protein
MIKQINLMIRLKQTEGISGINFGNCLKILFKCFFFCYSISLNTSIIIYYNGGFMDLFESKIRKVGTSLGVLIPAENAAKSNLKEGLKVEVAIIKKDLKLIDEMFGFAKKAGKFKREHSDRVV